MDDDPSTGGRIGECISEEVRENLEDAIGVDVDGKRTAVVDLQRDAFVVELGSQARRDSTSEVGQVFSRSF